jgi:peptidoglycan glycosyltransferase
VHANDRYARRNEPTGKVDMKEGIVASSNVYFAALAHEVVGADSLLKELDYFGFNVGNPGLTSFQKVRLLEEPDNLRQAGFGQGPITGSPLQVALVSATIANRGVLPEVRWVREAAERRRPVQYVMMPHQAQVLAGFMRGVVTEPGGTGSVLREVGIPMAGKTGTAEEKMTKLRDGKPVRVTLNHAWFTGFAPYYEPGQERGPQIAIAVLVEEGGSGGRAAAPIAGDIAEAAVDLGLIKNPEVLNH